ncbi:hypothetical protein FRB96_004802 [Tulasnella sp. 330]|nr:hypothetical protein FRB96_004802 [Tulasnella sp. 330]KAG8883329.1 hypothetical protein FRB98_003175 [Tulasnella sp. 332]
MITEKISATGQGMGKMRAVSVPPGERIIRMMVTDETMTDRTHEEIMMTKTEVAPGQGQDLATEEMNPTPTGTDEPAHLTTNPSNGHGWGGGIGGGGDWMEHRRKQREASTLSIWPPSPKAPARDDSPSRHHKSSKKTKRSRSNDSDVSTDSEADRRSRKDKKSSKHRSSRHRSHKFSSSKKSHRRHSSDDDDSASEADDFDKRQHYKKGKEREKDTQDRESRSRSEAHSNESMERDVGKLDVRDDEEGYWVEAQTAPGSDGAVAPRTEAEAIALVSGAQMDLDDDGDDDEIGPVPLRQADGKVDERAYGGALLRGEGSAMAAFVQDGQRIPRRGEIGLTSDQIDAYEKVGYVMSGSRHRRMNAVRMRKENQVISAEEKRGILKMQKEEKMKREALIVGGFKEIVEERLKGTGQK